MSKWVACEFHTHTVASDGDMTLFELVQRAKEQGIECLAITDHNTMIREEERVKAEKDYGINIIRGLEWTTFYGHMTILGIKDYIDWRKTGINNIHTQLKVVHEQGAIAGVAHPYSMGGALCTGCHWEFRISDWDDFDYIEVWSEVFPTVREKNIRAFKHWTNLLNTGHKVTAISGRDWHSNRAEKHPITVTYINIISNTEDFSNSIISSIKKGRVFVSSGPVINFNITDNKTNITYSVGDEVLLEDTVFDGTAEVEMSFTKHDLMVDINKSLKIKLVSNLGTIREVDVKDTNHIEKIEIKLNNLTWLRAEIYGCLQNKDNTMIAFTNPIYFK